MTAEGLAAAQLATFKSSQKMQEIVKSIQLATNGGAKFAFILNEKLGSTRDAVLIVTLLRIDYHYTVTFHKEGIAVKL
ncbi:hypothetical protein ON064_00465 [Planococcus sp. A6]|uniref:hypothetical protein n=1 Tax=Planococcus sp. A6 TaxID=2992760 RepID=UPI00237A16BA|nr:hypothetical protein [Planococcus sp. A6]MDE0581521.1 hypothetical protein [Planococcus sp. A6]